MKSKILLNMIQTGQLNFLTKYFKFFIEGKRRHQEIKVTEVILGWVFGCWSGIARFL